MNHSEVKKINVVGDLMSDWMLTYQGDQSSQRTWNFTGNAGLFHQWGGYLLLHSLLKYMVSSQTSIANWEILAPMPLPEKVIPDDANFHHSYSLWAPYKNKTKSQIKGENKVWRIENFLGTDTRIDKPSLNNTSTTGNETKSSEVLVINDTNLGYRDESKKWHLMLSKHQGWIALKMTEPIAQGPLWEELIDQHAERLIVVTTAQDLRKSNVQISKKISWERTAQDVFWELTYNPLINSLTQAAYNIVSFNCAGAILLSTDTKKHIQGQLIFDPTAMEEDWERAYPGSLIGYKTCLTASIVYQIMLNEDRPDLIQAIQSGISAMRALHEEGYVIDKINSERSEFHFPFQEIAQEICLQKQSLAVTTIEDPINADLDPRQKNPSNIQNNYWTILDDQYTNKLEEVSRKIVLDGVEIALTKVPIGKFGALVTVDRREIEALNGIQRLISDYCSGAQKKPLSIAVFGPPGSGKSFGVEQVAKSAIGDISVLSFNISQFHEVDDLLNALHQVRDIGLSGKIPLVFWDEFDTSLNGQALGWLRYFLAPMQDGAFQEGQIVHPIGRCIFVFAGGTSRCMELFGNGLNENEQRAIKLPDFISRLKGFLNVMGPNPSQGISDPFFVIRRALILRSIIERNVPAIISTQDGKRVVHIDPGLLRALLFTRQYKHGVRSMESIIGMSTLSGKSDFDRSSLPTEEQLNLHVDAPEFISLLQTLELKGELLEKLAAAAHEIFCDSLRSQGYVLGVVKNKSKKMHTALMPYSELPEHEKEQNRENVRDIPHKLILAGYIMRPARSNEPPFKFPGNDLEKLSAREHERWMNYKILTGWRYSPKTDQSRKAHQLLIPWEKLSEEEKEKDRILVRAIPVILAKAGYAVEKITNV